MSDESENIGRDALIGRDRIRGANRVIRAGTPPEQVTPEQIQAVAADVELFRRANKISRKDIASTIGYSPSVISEFLSGKYAGASGQVALDVEAWLVDQETQKSRPEATSFVWSNVAQLIRAAASYALDYKGITLVFSPDSSGLGKSTALRAIHQDFGPRRSSMIVMDKVDANPSAMLAKICGALHIERSGSAGKKFNRIVDELRGRSHILLIDEIHSLRGSKDDKCLYILANLADATQTAQLWCGTADMVAYLNRQRQRSHDESLAQLRSRIFPVIRLEEALSGQGGGGEPLVTVQQVREMFAKNQLRLTGDVERFLCKLVNLPDRGAVRLAVQLVTYATMIGKMTGKTMIEMPLIREAMRRCLPGASVETLLHEIENPPAQTAKVA